MDLDQTAHVPSDRVSTGRIRTTIVVSSGLRVKSHKVLDVGGNEGQIDIAPIFFFQFNKVLDIGRNKGHIDLLLILIFVQ